MSKRKINHQLERQQLDRRLKDLWEHLPTEPQAGWVKTIRDAMEMTSTQLARQLGIARQNLSKIEKNERVGTISINTLKKVANALDCDVRISLIPRGGSIENVVAQRARKVATEIVKRTSLHMNLEKQGTEKSFQEKEIDRITQDLIRNSDRRIWD